MALDSHFTSTLRAALDDRASSPPLQPFPLSPVAPRLVSFPPSPKRRRTPPCLAVGNVPASLPEDDAQPALFVQPASPAMSTIAPAFDRPPTSPYPPPIPSTSTSPPPTVSTFQLPIVPPSPGGGLAARRAAKLGKKRLSLVVPTPSSASSSLLSPTTPSYLRPGDDLDDAETRSLPPSPVSLQTFIGAEGSEAPDRTIGRLMLKQQADEMREQMRGGRGMKRRTSIPRLNLAGASAPAKPASLSSLPPRTAGGNGVSAVQFLRREGGVSLTEDEKAGEVEEFPYALGPREILPGIFLGSEQNAKDAQILREWKIGFVLNVAKEVECPWVDDTIEEEEDDRMDDPLKRSGGAGSPACAAATSASPEPPSRPTKPKHRRTKTQAAIDVKADAPPGSEPRPIRPPFIRPTVSTPNLQSVFRAARPPSPPPVPPISSLHPPAPALSEPMLRSLSSSPPNSQSPLLPRRSPPRLRAVTPRDGAVRFPLNARSGRPSIEYLWLKWGHDEADLVEAQKFQAAFDFLDEARSRDERVLVHCQCGVSRSATVVIAYCMREAAKALEEGRDAKELAGCTGMHDTYSFVKEKSEWVGPNLGLLVAYERTLRGDAGNHEDDEESPYPQYPPEPVSSSDDELPPPPSASSHRSLQFGAFAFPRAFGSPRTPISPEGSVQSEFSTPDLHDPLSPTFSTGTKASSVNSTPLSVVVERERDSLGLSQPVIVRPGEGETEFDLSNRDRHSSIDTLRGEDPGPDKRSVFILSAPPRRLSSSNLPLEEVLSPTTAFCPASAHGPPTLYSRTLSRTTRPPPLSLGSGNGHAGSGHPPPISIRSDSLSILVEPSVPIASPEMMSPLPPRSPSPSGPLSVTPSGLPSPALSVDASSGVTGPKKFGATQTRSERRASHRRVFSDHIVVPNPRRTSWSSAGAGAGAGAKDAAGPR
ncbi:SPOSA6832_00335, partial [Sporobolomyces salmonicolor]